MSLEKFDFGKISDVEEVDGVVNNSDSFLDILPKDENTHLPSEFYDCCCGSGKNVTNLPFSITCLSERMINSMIDHMGEIEGKCMVLCGTGARASCLIGMYHGVVNKLSAEETLDWAEEQSLPFVTKPVLRNIAFAHLKKREMGTIIFRQLFEGESSTYSYILACEETREGVIIDPVVETAERDAQLIKEMGITLKYGINTHCHADHVTGTAKLREEFPEMQSVIAEASGARADWKVHHDDKIRFGNRLLTCKSTLGHTSGCMTFVLDDLSMCFTGDVLLIRGCGRTDFQEGSSSTLYDSVHNEIFTLPPNTQVYPAHDYRGRTSSTVGEEARYNPRLTKTKEEFGEIMDNLGLAYPKQIDRALPLNLVCGVHELLEPSTTEEKK